VTIELHALCGYPAYKGYNDADFQARNLVKSLKRQSFNGYSLIRGQDGVERRVDAESPDAALRIFTAWALPVLNSLGLGRCVLVPIPSSQHVERGQQFTANRLAEAINVRADGAYVVEPCLTQREAVLASSKGGSRKYVDIRENLVCHSEFRGERVVLVDDVCTSGNHLKASAEILRRAGAEVGHAICAGRTVWERPPNIFSIPVENVDWDKEAGGLFGSL